MRFIGSRFLGKFFKLLGLLIIGYTGFLIIQELQYQETYSKLLLRELEISRQGTRAKSNVTRARAIEIVAEVETVRTTTELMSTTPMHGNFTLMDDFQLTYNFRMRSSSDKQFWVMMHNPANEKRIVEMCRNRTYDLSKLSSTSVIISFHDSEKSEHLLHTLHSIVYNTPATLLHEIILIADNTMQPQHNQPLQKYVSRHFPGLVKIHYSREQLGLIKGRLTGIGMATGDVIVVMDSHMELQPMWLEALLYEIYLNPKTMATAFLDWMKPNPDGSWNYEHGSSRYKTVWFWWNFMFTFMEIPQPQPWMDQDPTKSVISPASVGTIWAMNRAFFYECGALDDGMVFWGGENIDLPIRAFLFGGRHVNVPCSHAAHLEEKGQRNYRVGHMVDTKVNYLRLVETWLDDYKETFYLYNPLLKGVPYGDLSSRLAIKEKATHNFQYYLRSYYPEIGAPDKDSFAWGMVRNLGFIRPPRLGTASSSCCAYMDYFAFILKMSCYCMSLNNHQRVLFWNTRGEFRLVAHLFAPLFGLITYKIYMQNSVEVYGTKEINRWIHWKDGPIAVYVPRRLSWMCAEAPATTSDILLKPCDLKNKLQLWTFEHYTADYDALVRGSYNQQFSEPEIATFLQNAKAMVAQKTLTSRSPLEQSESNDIIEVNFKL